jgi:Fe-S-cluster-containing dehydrogenase component
MTRYAMVIDLNTCVGCNACMAACTIENQTPVWAGKFRTYVHDKEISKGEFAHRRFFPRLCNHCANPACMKVCPTGATYKKPDGIVMVDEELCMGCRACMMACPYGARLEYTYGDVTEGGGFYGEDFRRRSPSVDKCTFCDHRVEKGLPPACVETCVGSARMFGNLDDPGDPVAQLVASGVARPPLDHLGTEPSVFYIDDLKRGR